MIESRPTRRHVKPSEQGYVLLIAIFFLALLTIGLAVAMPKVAKAIQRDREVETFQRGKQYRRAIQLYYRKFNAYPPSVEALVKTNNIRFLRKRYIDPVTGKDDWKPIRFGQNKAPVVMGFFGQSMGGNGSSLAGTGPSGGNGLNGTSGGSLFSDTSNTSGSDTSSTSGSGSTAGSNGSSSSSTGLTGQSFGGGGIIGFTLTSANQSILIYKKKDHYNEWEFTYDPMQDRKTITSGGFGGTTSSSTSSSTFGSSTTSTTSSSSSNSTTASSSSSPQ
jgi:hypothetical protein